MRFFRHCLSPDIQSFPSHEKRSDYALLITENLAYIENQCRRAVLRCSALPNEGGAGFSIHDDAILNNEADELLNEVLDRLKADDFKALREFRGKAKLTTYLTTIISNLIVDLARQKKGRSRARERAREMGEVATRLYDLVFARGCSLHEAHNHLEITYGIREPLEKLQELLERMRGRERAQMTLCNEEEAAWLVPGRKMLLDGAVEVVVADPRKSAEASLISGQKQILVKQVVTSLIADLNGEERLIFAMRFPANDDEDPISNKKIGQMLGLSEKAVDTRIRRILVRFRESMLRQGFSLDDLIDA